MRHIFLGGHDLALFAHGGTDARGVFNPLARLREQAAARAAAGLRRRLVARQHTPSGSPLLDLASNDYLGLAGDPRLAEAAARAARAWGTGATGSRLVTGTTALHEELEAELAGFTGAASALVFSSGYLANLAAVTALAAALARPRWRPDRLRRGEPRLADRRLPPGEGARRPPAGDPARRPGGRRAGPARPRRAGGHRDHRRGLLGLRRPGPGRRSCTRLARAHGAILLVDEAHSFGVLGAGGRGAGHDAGLAAQPDLVRTVTLSKALSGQGGAVLGAAEVRQTLIDTGRGFIFDTGLAPPSAGAALAALGILRDRPDLPERARWNTKRLAAIAADLGLAATDAGRGGRLGHRGRAAGGSGRAANLRRAWGERRVLPPAVSPGRPGMPAADRTRHLE